MEYGMFDERLGRSPEKIWLLPLEERERRIKEIYHKKMGCELNLKKPRTFTEKIQWYKLYYHNPLMTQCVDKVEVKKYIAEKLGKAYTAKLLDVWETPDEVSFDTLPDKFVLKSNCQYDGTYIKIIYGKENYNLKAIIEETKKYYFNPQNLLINGFCSAYHDVIPKVFAEEYIRDFSGQAAREFKIFCFDGVPMYSNVISKQIVNHKIIAPQEYEYSYYTVDDWKRIDMIISSRPPCYDAPKPYHYEEVLEVSRILSKDFPFVRVDFIDTADRLYIGELTFYPSGGLCIYEPREFDVEIGSHFNIPEVISSGSQI